MIKTIGNKERLILTSGAKENKVDSALVAKALGAEFVGYVGENPHNLPMPKLVQERLSKASKTTQTITDETEAKEPQLVSVEMD